MGTYQPHELNMSTRFTYTWAQIYTNEILASYSGAFGQAEHPSVPRLIPLTCNSITNLIYWMTSAILTDIPSANLTRSHESKQLCKSQTKEHPRTKNVQSIL